MPDFIEHKCNLRSCWGWAFPQKLILELFPSPAEQQVCTQNTRAISTSQEPGGGSQGVEPQDSPEIQTYLPIETIKWRDWVWLERNLAGIRVRSSLMVPIVLLLANDLVFFLLKMRWD